MPGIWNPIIEQGATFNPVLRYSSPDFTIIPVTAVTKSARAHVTAVAHGIVGKTKVFISGVAGMKQINSRDLTRIDKAYTATPVDSDHLSLDVDSSEFSAYISGGELVYNTPVNLVGYTGLLEIRPVKGSSTILVSLTTSNGGLTLGGAAGTIQPFISSTDTALYTWLTGVVDLELTSPGSPPSGAIKTRLLTGRVRVDIDD